MGVICFDALEIKMRVLFLGLGIIFLGVFGDLAFFLGLVLFFSFCVFLVDLEGLYMGVGIDRVSFSLTLLRVWFGIMLFLSGVMGGLAFSSYELKILIGLLTLALVISFSVPNLFLFYLSFEFSLIPIFFMILG